MNKYKEDTKRFDAYSKARTLCKCGHSLIVGRTGKTICNYCGRYVYKDKKKEFEERLKKVLC